MYAPSPQSFVHKLALSVLFTSCVWAANVPSAIADPLPPALTWKRLVQEVRELKRLAFQIKRDESKLRKERDQVSRYLANAQRYANGGHHNIHRTSFFALLRTFEQTPGQASLLQTYVPVLEPDNFYPEPKAGFPGGYPADLLEFCRKNHLGLRYGGRAHLIVSELSRDLVYKAGNRVAELDERIERFKSQNIAHTDLLGRLMLCAQHCEGCHSCYHHGYGHCGFVTPVVLDHPIAGLNSKAYDRDRSPGVVPSRETAVTDHRRLPFLVPDGPAPATDDPINSIARSQRLNPEH